jgi:hypothetical protein
MVSSCESATVRVVQQRRISPERFNTLRMSAAIAHAPEAAERVSVAQEVVSLDAKLASVAAEIPRSFYNPGVEKGMATRVEVDAPLSTGEGQ